MNSFEVIAKLDYFIIKEQNLKTNLRKRGIVHRWYDKMHSNKVMYSDSDSEPFFSSTYIKDEARSSEFTSAIKRLI